MRQFTTDDLTAIMRGCAGMDQSGGFNGAELHVSYSDLGYDSLAVLEIQAEIQRRFGIPVGDDAMDAMPTPAATVSYVNTLLRAGV
ncbi:MAG TPA: acyl carrier protein [Streptosporangiaceae bacterium]|jgi:act minimal PKS acyl carrier protein|nr:acyl carrier protein [Streptosporangiaceae bacterium]